MVHLLLTMACMLSNCWHSLPSVIFFVTVTNIVVYIVLCSCRTISVGAAWKMLDRKNKKIKVHLYPSSVLIKIFSLYQRCSGELQTQKLKAQLLRTQSSNVLPFTPGQVSV